ncbi:MAG: DUF805 domain-containing protein [Caldimonas sp.]
MTFQESIRTCFSKYADFTGRAVRSEYWWFALFVVVVSLALSLLSNVASSVFGLATIVPSISAATRRLHDTNRSGWWQLISLVPIIGVIVLIVFLAQEGKPQAASLAA